MKSEFTEKTLQAECFNCGYKFRISPKQFVLSYRIYCPSCRKYFDNPHAPRFKTA